MAGDGGKPTQQPHAHHPHHHAHIKTADSGTPVGQIAVVGLVIALLGGGGLWYLNRKGEDNKLNTLFVSAEARHISTVNGQRGDVTLSDGSKLTIGPSTKLTIIPKYNEQYRGVMVEGTTAFEVKDSPAVPLEIRAGGAALVLASGSVVVRSYADEGESYIKIASGSGELRAKDVRRQVTGPVAVKVGKDSSITDADAAAADLATSWVGGTVKINEMPLKGVLKLFDKYYALNMKVTDEGLLARPVTMEAQLDSKQKAISALEASAGVKFAYDGSTPTLKDDPKAKKK